MLPQLRAVILCTCCATLSSADLVTERRLESTPVASVAAAAAAKQLNLSQAESQLFGDFDCTKDLVTFAVSWSNEKKAYCCTHSGLGCIFDAATTTTTTITTTTTTTIPTTTIGSVTAPTIPPPSNCPEPNVAYEPLGMDGTWTQAATVDECQALCRKTSSCFYYNYYQALGHCYFTYAEAIKWNGRYGFIGGPAFCDYSGSGASNATLKTLLATRTCMVTNTSYYPLCGRGRPTTYETSPLACQAECANTSWCTSFVFNTLLHTCDLQDNSSVEIAAPVYTISGPPQCVPLLTLTIILDGLDDDADKLLAQKAASGLQKQLPMLSLFNEAIINFLGDWSPFVNGEEQPSRPVATLEQVVSARMVQNGNDTVFKIGIGVDSQTTLYISALMRNQSVRKELEDYLNNVKDARMPHSKRIVVKEIAKPTIEVSTENPLSGYLNLEEIHKVKTSDLVSAPERLHAYSLLALMLASIGGTAFVVVAVQRCTRSEELSYRQIRRDVDGRGSLLFDMEMAGLFVK